MNTGSDRLRRALIVVPTLGRRPVFLHETLASLTSQSQRPDIVLVAPKTAREAIEIGISHGASVANDPGGLSAAINAGVYARSDSHDYVSWLGDDDLLVEGSLATTVAALDRTADAVVAFGDCHYIDEFGRTVGTNRAGRIAPWLLPWGPDLVPQPGMLVRMADWLAVGGLDEHLNYAMDLDLLLRLRRRGRLLSVGRPVSCFRWHPDSLTVGNRSLSSEEAEAVKRRYLPPLVRSYARLWEGPVRIASARAAKRVSRLALSGRGDGRALVPDGGARPSEQ